MSAARLASKLIKEAIGRLHVPETIKWQNKNLSRHDLLADVNCFDKPTI